MCDAMVLIGLKSSAPLQALLVVEIIDKTKQLTLVY
jgi:hypothetical protein